MYIISSLKRLCFKVPYYLVLRWHGYGDEAPLGGFYPGHQVGLLLALDVENVEE